jgi:hypothetical protein
MLMCCVCAFSLHLDSPDIILVDELLVSKVVLSQESWFYTIILLLFIAVLVF